MDLYPDQVIAITKQVNKLNELKDRQADYSNQFPIPPTGNNLRITGFPNLIKSDSINPYTKLPCKYIENGSELISNGLAIIEDFEGAISVTLYSGIFDFFDILGDSTLRDLDLSELDHVFGLDGVIAGNANDSNYLYPLIQWGATNKNNSIVDIRYQVPCIRVPYLVDKIFENAGYNKSGGIFDLESYQKLITPIVEESLYEKDEALDSYSFKAHIEEAYDPYEFSVAPSNGLEIIKFNYFSSGDAFDSSAGWYLIDKTNSSGIYINRKYIVQKKIVANIRVRVYFQLTSSIAGSTATGYTLFVRKNKVEDNQFMYFTTGNLFGGFNGYKELIVENYTLYPGDTLDVCFRSHSYTTIFPTGSNISEPSNYSYFEVEAINTNDIGESLTLTNVAPEVKQKDLLKDIAYIYGIVFQINNLTRTVEFKQFKEIATGYLTSNNYVDWSDKFDLKSGYKVNYRFGDYAQRNHLVWLQDDDRAVIGNGIILCDDNTLPSESTLLETTFAASIQETQFKGDNVGVNIKKFTLVEADDYNSEAEYTVGDIVKYGGFVYEAIQDATGIAPTDPLYWEGLERQYEQTESVAPRLLLERDYEDNLIYHDGDKDNDVIVEYNPKYQVKINSIFGFVQVYGDMDVDPGDTVYITETTGSNGVFTVSTVNSNVDGKLLLLSGEDDLTVGNIGVIQKGTNPKIAYFVDPLRDYHLGFDFLIPEHYQEFSNVLNKTKILTAKFNLSENDFKNINFFKPVYIDYLGQYFYINQVSNYISGRLTTVELVRL